jgi:hypothetical protein
MKVYVYEVRFDYYGNIEKFINDENLIISIDSKIEFCYLHGAMPLPFYRLNSVYVYSFTRKLVLFSLKPVDVNRIKTNCRAWFEKIIERWRMG